MTEILGVWVHPGFFGPEKNTAIPKIQATLDEYLRVGINTLIVEVKSTSGLVFYKSQIAQRVPGWDWDFLGVFLEEAKKRDMIVHPWFCVFPEAGIFGQVSQHPEWLIHGKRSELVGVANPALPHVRQYEISLMTEVIGQYPADWVHLDYIRYSCVPTEVYFSFDSQTRSLFKAYSGEDPLNIKNDNSGNIFWNEWIEWNADQVTQFMRELREALKTTGRSIKISAAVFPNADNAKVLIGQDWARWSEDGLVDMLCPMLYTNHHGFFEKCVQRGVQIARGHCQMCAGIGVSSSHNQNTPEGVVEQLNISRRLGADGVIFFSIGSLTGEFLEKLRMGE